MSVSVVRNISFSDYFLHVLNERSLTRGILLLTTENGFRVAVYICSLD